MLRVPITVSETKPISPLVKKCRGTQPVSRCSLEFFFYLAYMMCIVLYGWSTVSAASLKFRSKLKVQKVKWSLFSYWPMKSQGYDLNDGQWRQFDQWLGVLVIFLLFTVVSSRCIRHMLCKKVNENFHASILQGYHAFNGLLFLAFLHGPAFVFPLLIVLTNYVFVTQSLKFRISFKAFMTIMWVFHLGVLLCSAYNEGFHKISFLGTFFKLWPRRIRWIVVYNLYTLRMIAFNMDYYWAVHDGSSQHERAVRKHDTLCLECALMREACNATDEQTRCYKFRTECPRPLNEYNMLSYMAYMFYVPLYIAGPMSSFNAFASHCRYATQAMPWRLKLFYALRILGIYVLLVTMLHFLYVNAFRAAPRVFLALSIPEKAYVGYYSLAFLWLKFSLIWKVTRFVAVLDGFDVPEDMRRCFTNTVSVRDFWRDWHASFNLWIVRYMYIPMGGNRKKYLIIFPIFMFIAIWHDMALHLIKWALCVIIIFVLEISISSFWNTSHAFASLRSSKYERLCRSIGSLFSVFGLIVANLIGFSSHSYEISTEKGKVNLETDSTIWKSIESAGFNFFFVTCGLCYGAASIGIIIRDLENARDIEEKQRLGLIPSSRFD